ncbi:MAG: lipoate-protein ligase B, partial [Sphingomonadaceae bacterium]
LERNADLATFDAALALTAPAFLSSLACPASPRGENEA